MKGKMNHLGLFVTAPRVQMQTRYPLASQRRKRTPVNLGPGMEYSRALATIKMSEQCVAFLGR